MNGGFVNLFVFKLYIHIYIYIISVESSLCEHSFNMLYFV